MPADRGLRRASRRTARPPPSAAPILIEKKKSLYYDTAVKRAISNILVLLSFSTIGLITAGAAQVPAQEVRTTLKVSDLSPKYKQWLDEEVVYIITKKEKEIFLQLQTDRERDIFIEAFWKQRDPTPGTDLNEFKDEHYRRIKYANDKMGKDSPGPGWKSDMGRIYIILGEPKQITRYDNQSDIYPLQVWFYEGMTEFGLPNAFYVVFFKKYNAGDFILYSPIRDGPQQLMVHYSGDMTSYTDAYQELDERYPELSNLSISLIPGEVTTAITPNMTSDILIQAKIPRAPTYKVKDTYAEKLLAYKDLVDVDYTANYIDSDSMAFVFEDPRKTPFIHYLIEPSRLSFAQYNDRFVSNLEIDGNITDEKGRFVYQFSRKVPIEMNSQQLASIKDKLFSFQDLFPAVPGTYRLNVILKNTVSKEFTTIESRIKVPAPGTAWISPLLLSNRTDRGSKYAGQVKPFMMGGVQFRPSPRNDFLSTDTMGIFFQVHNLSRELLDTGRLELSFLRDDQKVDSLVRKFSEIPNLDNILEEFPMSKLPPAYYVLTADVIDAQGRTVVSEKAPFYVTQYAAISRPWVLSMPFDSQDSPEIAYILGKQRLNMNELDEALPLLQSAFKRVPTEQKYALDLAEAYYRKKDYGGVKGTVLTFVEDPAEPRFLLLMAESCRALGQMPDAISMYKTYLNRFGTNMTVLNSLADCLVSVGSNEEALALYEKSLQMDQNQPAIKERIKSLKEKK